MSGQLFNDEATEDELVQQLGELQEQFAELQEEFAELREQFVVRLRPPGQ